MDIDVRTDCMLLLLLLLVVVVVVVVVVAMSVICDEELSHVTVSGCKLLPE